MNRNDPPAVRALTRDCRRRPGLRWSREDSDSVTSRALQCFGGRRRHIAGKAAPGLRRAPAPASLGLRGSETGGAGPIVGLARARRADCGRVTETVPRRRRRGHLLDSDGESLARVPQADGTAAAAAFRRRARAGVTVTVRWSHESESLSPWLSRSESETRAAGDSESLTLSLSPAIRRDSELSHGPPTLAIPGPLCLTRSRGRRRVLGPGPVPGLASGWPCRPSCAASGKSSCVRSPAGLGLPERHLPAPAWT